MGKMGVDIKSSGPSVQLKVAKDLEKSEIEALQKAGLSKDIINQLKPGNTVNLAEGSLKNLIESKGINTLASLEKSGITLAETKEGLKLTSNGKLDSELLKKVGLSNKAIKALEKEGSCVINKGSIENLAKTAGRNELSAITKAGVNVEQKAVMEIAAKEGSGLLGK
jgi:ribosomal protein L15